MELKCALVVTLASLVSCTPRGYGALTKADASAVAGAHGGLGEIPLSALGVPGLSGSYSSSKSSSSSYASSSASSSSNSFSFSGSGTGGLSGNNNFVPSNSAVGVNSEGCSSGACQTNSNGLGSTDVTGNTETGQSFSGAKAGAAAGAIAFDGLLQNSNSGPCTGGDCQQKPSRCQGSDCDFDKTCKTGQCGVNSKTTSTADESNDIPINIVGGSGLKSTSSNSLKTNVNAGSGTSNSIKSSSFDSYSSPTDQHKPATFLTTPNHAAPCTSPSCGSTSGGAYSPNLPSSYNVPILGPYSTSNTLTQDKVPCTTGSCSGKDAPANSPGYSEESLPSFVPLKPVVSTDCATPDCAGSSSSQQSVSSPSKYPTHSHSPDFQSQSAFNVPSSKAGLTTDATASSSAGVVSTGSALEKDLPPYTGGFGGSAGILKPNDYNVPSSIPASNYKPIVPTVPQIQSSYTHTAPAGSHGSSQPGQTAPQSQYNPSGSYTPALPTGGNSPSACSSGSCALGPGQTAPQNKPSGSFKPSSGTFKPPTGSYSPSACSSGNCVSQVGQTIPQYNPSGSYKPVPSPGPSSTLSCSSGNCSEADLTAPQYNPITSYKPVLSTGPSGCSSGICDSQTGLQTPQYNPTGSYKPVLSTGPSSIPSCSSGNCGSQAAQPASQYNPSESYKPVPSMGPSSTSGCFSGNCGSQAAQPAPQYNPSGSYKPVPSMGLSSVSACSSGNCVSQAAHQYDPSGSYKPVPSTGPSSTSGCSSGNCGAHAAQSTPQYNPSGSFVHVTSTGPSSTLDCSSGNCGAPVQPAPQSNPNVSYKPESLSGPSSTSGCSSGNCGSQASSHAPQYTPSGSYKPVPPTGPYNPSTCLSGNCASQPILTAPQSDSKYQAVAPSGSFIPTCTSGNCKIPGQSPSQFVQSGSTTGVHYQAGQINTLEVKKPVSCTSGNCGTQSTQTTSQSSASSGSHYKPGVDFGGPTGILKPHDFTVPSNVPQYNSPTVPVESYKPVTCTSSSCEPGQLLPQYDSMDSLSGSQQKPLVPTGSYGIQIGTSGITAPVGASQTTTCTSGNCGKQPGHASTLYGQSGTSGAHAVASAGVAYTGNFGGPPGFLKPYDGEKAGSLNLIGFGGKQSILETHNTGSIHSSYGKSINGMGTGSVTSAQSGAQASAIAGSSAGGYSSQPKNIDDTLTGGCKLGCGSDGSANFELNNGSAGFSGLNIAGAAAKSVANAGASSFGLGGSFASSSASAHASAGAATKGGYGKR